MYVRVVYLARVHSSSHTHTHTFQISIVAHWEWESFYGARSTVCSKAAQWYGMIMNGRFCRDIIKMKKHFIQSRHLFWWWLCTFDAVWLNARALVCVRECIKDVDVDMAAAAVMCQALDTDTFSHFESVLIEINAKPKQKRATKMRLYDVGVYYNLK